MGVVDVPHIQTKNRKEGSFLSLTPSQALLYLSVARLLRKGRQLSLEESETAQLSLSSLSLSLLSLSLSLSWSRRFFGWRW